MTESQLHSDCEKACRVGSSKPDTGTPSQLSGLGCRPAARYHGLAAPLSSHSERQRRARANGRESSKLCRASRAVAGSGLKPDDQDRR